MTKVPQIDLPQPQHRPVRRTCSTTPNGSDAATVIGFAALLVVQFGGEDACNIVLNVAV